MKNSKGNNNLNMNKKDKVNCNKNVNKKYDLMKELFNFNGIYSDELAFSKDDYFIKLNWNVGDDYVYSYERDDFYQNEN